MAEGRKAAKIMPGAAAAAAPGGGVDRGSGASIEETALARGGKPCRQRQMKAAWRAAIESAALRLAKWRREGSAVSEKRARRRTQNGEERRKLAAAACRETAPYGEKSPAEAEREEGCENAGAPLATRISASMLSTRCRRISIICNQSS